LAQLSLLTDLFEVRFTHAAGNCLGSDRITGLSTCMAHPITVHSVAANAADTITMVIESIGGTGQADVFNDPRYNRIHALFIPT
jgi:hypothetical protein